MLGQSRHLQSVHPMEYGHRELYHGISVSILNTTLMHLSPLSYGNIADVPLGGSISLVLLCTVHSFKCVIVSAILWGQDDAIICWVKNMHCLCVQKYLEYKH